MQADPADIVHISDIHIEPDSQLFDKESAHEPPTLTRHCPEIQVVPVTHELEEAVVHAPFAGILQISDMQTDPDSQLVDKEPAQDLPKDTLHEPDIQEVPARQYCEVKLVQAAKAGIKQKLFMHTEPVSHLFDNDPKHVFPIKTLQIPDVQFVPGSQNNEFKSVQDDPDEILQTFEMHVEPVSHLFDNDPEHDSPVKTRQKPEIHLVPISQKSVSAFEQEVPNDIKHLFSIQFEPKRQLEDKDPAQEPP